MVVVMTDHLVPLDRELLLSQALYC